MGVYRSSNEISWNKRRERIGISSISAIPQPSSRVLKLPHQKKSDSCILLGLDRHWTRNEFAEVLSDMDLSGCIDFLEVGCGVGNLLFPLMEYYPNWRLHGIDFSHNALDLLNRRAIGEGLHDRGKLEVGEGNCPLCVKSQVY